MHISQHANQRMNQRGISRWLIEFTLRFGRIEGDKRIMDKGGVVVFDGESDPSSRCTNVDAPVHRRKAAVSALRGTPGWPGLKQRHVVMFEAHPCKC